MSPLYSYFNGSTDYEDLLEGLHESNCSNPCTTTKVKNLLNPIATYIVFGAYFRFLDDLFLKVRC